MDKKKKFNTNRVAAYALSGVMLASVIPYNVFATEDQAQNALNNAAAASEPGLEVSPSEAPSQVRDAAAPEDTSTSADAKNAVHGFVGVLVGGDINADLKAETGQRFKPIEGVRVYFQWYEKKGNRTSPTYSAVSGADGQFHMGIKPYIGRDGKLVKFDADTTVSAGDESYKMWVDESTIPEGYQLQYSTGEGVEFTDRKVAGGDYQLGPNRLVNYRVLLMEKQDEAKMHKGATQTTPQISKTGQGAVWGKVSWDYESAGGVQWGIVSTPTSPAGGVTVTASYLSDYALKQIYSANTAKMLGLSKPSDIRGSGWTFKLETQLQEWIAEQVAADKEKWIAETVSAKTNAEGDYLIQFKGTWGPHRNTSAVAEYERVAGKYYAGDAHKWSAEEANRLGTVAENAKDGSFLTGALDWNEKHVNSDWLFISTKDTDDVVKRTPWNYNWYTGSDNGWGIHGGWAQVAFGVSTVQAANSTRADFNLAPAEIKFNITNFDTQANTAIPGDVATTKTAGLPYKNTNDSFKIVWYDQDGKIVKEQKEAEKPTSTGALAESTFDTKDVKETKTFIAKLHYVKPGGGLGPVLAQDAFTVKVGKIVVSAYDDVNIANPGAKENEGATYKAEGLPEGLTIDKNTGTVSGKAKVPGKYTVTVTTSILDEDSGEIMEGTSNYTALVTDSPLEHGEVGLEYNKTVKPAEVEGYVFKEVSAKFIDGKVIEGLTITGDKISGTPKAEVAATQEGPNVEVTYDIYKLNSKGDAVLIKEGHKDLVPLEITKAASQAPKYEPAYTDVEGTPGAEAIVAAPKLLDQKSEADPKPEVTKPSNVKFALGDGAPEGATIDANTGAVTYTPTARDANTTVNIPVKVTYSDGTIDETLAKIKVGQAQADSYQPEYTEAEGKAGTEATVSAPNFKDAKGQATTKPEGVEFTIGKDAPTGATVDKTTGEVKYTPSIDDAGTVVNIPVIVIYKDGSADEVKAPIKVAQGDNLNYEPDYKSVVAQVAHEVTVASPDFLDTDGNKVAQKPAVAKYELGEGAKSGVTIDETTGEIKYTAVDADKDTVIEVPVVVTYADGSKESVTAKIDVPSDANFYDPKPFKLTTEQGTVPAAKDGVKFEFTPPADTKYEWQAVPKVNEAGETTGIVKISYPDGTEDLVEVPVTVKASASKKTTVDDTNKKPVDPTDQKQRTGIVVTNLDEKTTVSAKDANHKDVTPVINKVTGEIEVTPGTDATGPITVTVTDSDLPEGKRDIEVPVAEKSEKPGITAPTAGDQTISGTGTPGARVNLALKRVEDIPIANDVAVKDDGTWTADVPAGILLKENDTVVATQKEDGKSVSDPVEAKVGAKTPEVDKSALQAEVDKEDTTKADVKYTNATDEKKTAYDEAL
ncbi:Rib/alpha-like domain-containing protein, partial [Peptoniphilus harei]|uniref:Rib/alpha-like domain-containing protein n=1 Tax=Peptoniphilus harei TaxID=54005 RepID=UPI0029123817